jgi:hypothetical protein
VSAKSTKKFRTKRILCTLDLRRRTSVDVHKFAPSCKKGFLAVESNMGHLDRTGPARSSQHKRADAMTMAPATIPNGSAIVERNAR